jgi:hypothetical protein
MAVGAVLAPVRRGPLRLGFSWQLLWVRTADGQAFGIGDPKVFARLRVLGSAASRASFHIEGAARIPAADADLFPYGTGGQDIELAGTLGFGASRTTLVGCGYIWTEPRDHLTSADVPHALHVYASLGGRRGDWVPRARADAFWMEGGHERAEVEVSITRVAGRALHPTLVLGAGLGGDDERLYDVLASLRWAMPLR